MENELLGLSPFQLAIAAIIALGGVIAVLWRRNSALSDARVELTAKAVTALTASQERERVMAETASTHAQMIKEAGSVVGKMDKHLDRLDEAVRRLERGS